MTAGKSSTREIPGNDYVCRTCTPFSAATVNTGDILEGW